MTAPHDSSSLMRTLSDVGDIFGEDNLRGCTLRLVSEFATITGGMDVSLFLSEEGSWRVVASTNPATAELHVDRIRAGHPSLGALGDARTPVTTDFHPSDAPFDAYALGALNAGYAREYALPLRHAGRGIGAVVLLDAADLPVGRSDLARIQSVAHVAAAGLARVTEVEDLAARNRQLQRALESRIIIEQAKGVIAGRRNCDMVSAFEDLRQQARRARQPIEAVARATVHGHLPQVASATPPGRRGA